MTAVAATTNPAFLCPLCEGPATRLHRVAHTDIWRCAIAECGLGFAGPAPSDSELDEFYRTLYYPQASEDGGCFEDTPKAIFEDLVGVVDRSSDEPMRLLDFGAGRGELCRTALTLGLEPTGIERDPRARQYAMRDGAFRVHADIETLRREEPDRRFDTIVLWQVIEHLREPWRELGQLRDLLAPGGELIVATPNARSLKSRIQGAAWCNATNPTHLFYFSPTALVRALQRAGYERIERVRVVSDFPHHGVLRRAAQRWLRRAGLDGDLVYRARAASREA